MPRKAKPTDDFRHKCAYAASRLREWGEWMARNMADQHGLPHDTSFADRVGRGTAGQLLPIKPEPRKVAEISRIVANLEDIYREAVSVHYIMDIAENGTEISIAERAGYLRVSVASYNYRVSEGRKAVANKL